ncbi:MAG: TA system VapC family ribonuclease toxin, partial [Ilumatobacteraceae bacterium]
MRCVDVNVLVYAHRPESDRHAEYLKWVEVARDGDEPLGISDLVLSGFIRIVTHPKIFVDPTPTAEAFQFADLIRTSPSVVPLAPGPRHWDIFRRLSTAIAARGNVVPDAFLGAIAIEAGATWY